MKTSNSEIERALKFVNQEHFLTRKDLACRYNVRAETIDEWHTAGKLPKALYIGRKPRWSLLALLIWEKHHEQK